MQKNTTQTIKKGLYRHYKGQEYLVDKIVRHSETDEPMVLYQTRYGDFSWWVRPLAMFCESVNVEGKVIPRFEWFNDAIQKE